MSNIRYADPEQIDILDEYAKLDIEKQQIDNRMKKIRHDVLQILANEDDPSNVEIPGFRFEMKYIKQYNKAREQEEHEVSVNGQFIIASLRQLNEAKSALDKFTKREHWEIGGRNSITVKKR